MIATKADIADFKTELRETATRPDNKIDLGFRDATIKAGGMFIVAVGILLGAIKYFTH
jgi:hypothetical protein